MAFQQGLRSHQESGRAHFSPKEVSQYSKAVALGSGSEEGKGRLFRGRENKNLRTNGARGEALEAGGSSAVWRCSRVSSVVVGWNSEYDP